MLSPSLTCGHFMQLSTAMLLTGGTGPRAGAGRLPSGSLSGSLLHFILVLVYIEKNNFPLVFQCHLQFKWAYCCT